MEHSPIISAGMMEIDERLMGRTGNRLMGEQAATMRTLDFMRHCFKQSTDGAEKRTLNTLIDFLATDLVRLEDLILRYARHNMAIKLFDGFNADPLDLK